MILDNISFAYPWVTWFLPLPLLVYWLIPTKKQQHTALRLPHYDALGPALGKHGKSVNLVRWLWMLIIWILLLAATARPQIIGETINIPVTGRSLMMAVDVSGSMQTEDMEYQGQVVNRMRAVKAVAGEFVSKREGDRVGLILFGTQAYLQAPLTFDRKTVRTFLNEATMGLAGRETAIGDAIGLAVKRLREVDEKNRVLILLTDGENTSGNVDPLKAADLAAQEKVRIYTIGVGSDSQQVRTPFGLQMLRRNALDETSLRAIADKTGGRYFRAKDVQGLAAIYQLLDEIEPISSDELSYRPVQEYYQWPLAAAIVLLLAISMIRLIVYLWSSINRKKTQAVTHA